MYVTIGFEDNVYVHTFMYFKVSRPYKMCGRTAVNHFISFSHLLNLASMVYSSTVKNFNKLSITNIKIMGFIFSKFSQEF